MEDYGCAAEPLLQTFLALELVGVKGRTVTADALQEQRGTAAAIVASAWGTGRLA